MVERVPITREGYKKLEERLRHLREVERPQNVKDIAEARAHGDLSENAEYHAAKEKQGFIEAEIRDLTSKIARAEVIDPASIRETRVVFGATIQLDDLDNDTQVTYQIVGEDEVDLKTGRISVKSPIARALITKEEGDEVTVKTPKGDRLYEIIKIEYK
jgi:transcription elongation factor GreA